jgi:aryl-alcohol dehydrogenase-like predicted oxidoreductase
LLTGKINPGHTFNEGDTREGNMYYSDENIRRVNAFLDKLTPLAKDKKATIGQLVIKWTIEQPGITIALVGARNAAQAIENAGAGEIQLSSEELAFISHELAQVKLKK